MCTVLLPPDVNPTAVNKYISYQITSTMWVSPPMEEGNGKGEQVAKWGPATESVSQSTCIPTGQYYICNLCNSFFTNSFIFHAIQQNSFNLSADNPILQHLKIKSPQSSLPEKASSMKQAYLRDTFQTTSKECLYINHCGIS